MDVKVELFGRMMTMFDDSALLLWEKIKEMRMIGGAED